MSHCGEKPNNKVMRPAFIALLVALTFAAIEIVAAERDFSVPLDRLKAWSESITTSLNVEILGHSKVHSAAKCIWGPKCPATMATLQVGCSNR
jgi:hypothetical protein